MYKPVVLSNCIVSLKLEWFLMVEERPILEYIHSPLLKLSNLRQKGFSTVGKTVEDDLRSLKGLYLSRALAILLTAVVLVSLTLGP